MELRWERRGSTLLAELNRPERRNALTPSMLAALRDLLAMAGRGDATTTGVVLTGSGPAFCAGLDLDLLRTDPGAFAGHDVLSWFRNCAVPVIAAVNGPAVTGGMELALAADLRLASATASFTDNHSRVGVVPGWGMSALLPDLVGAATAFELSVTARTLDAEGALRHGLVSNVLPADQLLSEAEGIVDEIAAGNRSVQRQLLLLARQRRFELAAPSLRREADASAGWFATAGLAGG